MSELPTRPLGRTGVQVTTLGFGAMELRGAPRGPEISDGEAERVLNDVLDAGINFIDTSIDYGRSEELIGRFVSHRRDDDFLASKCGCVVGGAQGEQLRFTLSHPGLSTTIVGTRNPAHLRDNIHAAKKGPLPAGVLAEAKRRLAGAGSIPEPVDAPVKRAI